MCDELHYRKSVGKTEEPARRPVRLWTDFLKDLGSARTNWRERICHFDLRTLLQHTLAIPFSD
jgi:hypothetical protein